MKANHYSAEDVANILRAEGFSDINKRTVNYYAFDKKMFDVQRTGKKCFTDRELDKIRAIRLLREYTNLTLDQIKQIINTHSLEEIKQFCINRVASIGEYYGYPANPHTASAWANACTTGTSLPSETSYTTSPTSRTFTAHLKINGQDYGTPLVSDSIDDLFDQIKGVAFKACCNQNKTSMEIKIDG